MTKNSCITETSYLSKSPKLCQRSPPSAYCMLYMLAPSKTTCSWKDAMWLEWKQGEENG